MTTRILLADDHPLVLASLSRIANEVGAVVGAVPDGCTVIVEALRLQPDVIVLDLMMPGLSGLEAARVLRRDLPNSRVIVCTVHTNPRVIEEVLAAGAVGFVQKQSAYGDLAPAIRAALADEVFVSPALHHEESRWSHGDRDMELR